MIVITTKDKVSYKMSTLEACIIQDLINEARQREIGQAVQGRHRGKDIEVVITRSS